MKEQTGAVSPEITGPRIMETITVFSDRAYTSCPMAPASRASWSTMKAISTRELAEEHRQGNDLPVAEKPGDRRKDQPFPKTAAANRPSTVPNLKREEGIEEHADGDEKEEAGNVSRG